MNIRRFKASDFFQCYHLRVARWCIKIELYSLNTEMRDARGQKWLFFSFFDHPPHFFYLIIIYCCRCMQFFLLLTLPCVKRQSRKGRQVLSVLQQWLTTCIKKMKTLRFLGCLSVYVTLIRLQSRRWMGSVWFDMNCNSGNQNEHLSSYYSSALGSAWNNHIKNADSISSS